MSSVLKLVLSLAPYHILSYGTLLGTELYQVRTESFQKKKKPQEDILPSYSAYI